jgi:hypothetical protein
MVTNLTYGAPGGRPVKPAPHRPSHRRFAVVLAANLLIATAMPAQAGEATASRDERTPLQVVVDRIASEDAIYKGLIGKALDAVPMDPEHRVTLQRANAVVSNTVAGRSIATWLGWTNPLLWVTGTLWGIISAQKIQPAASVPTQLANVAAAPGFQRVEPNGAQGAAGAAAGSSDTRAAALSRAADTTLR